MLTPEARRRGEQVSVMGRKWGAPVGDEAPWLDTCRTSLLLSLVPRFPSSCYMKEKAPIVLIQCLV